MTTSAMLPTRVSLFILLSAFHLFNCVERSDWTYDRETQLANITIANGTTYSCNAWDIIHQAGSFELPSDGRVCLDPNKSENDPGCIPMNVLNIINRVFNAVEAGKNRSACIYPVPTEEETFAKIEKIYRSTLEVDDVAAFQKWIIEVSDNVTSMRDKYSENEDALKEIEAARNCSANALYNRAFRLPKQREEVSRLQDGFVDAKMILAALRNETSIRDESYSTLELRNQMLSLEITALRDGDDHQVELFDWHVLTKVRVNFMAIVSANKKLERMIKRREEDVVERRMDMLSAMAEANEIVGQTEYFMREVEYHFNLARQCTEIDKDLMEE